ncbi:MAG: (d)CMP kinase [Candidatus Omnitrophica bacterium]|nr:(d)CMP kinase [Candidatus Omnitrophota bacterium]MCM8827686.1 (d)CMP kinase [Candidatus Omnitrophota bacterium]
MNHKKKHSVIAIDGPAGAGKSTVAVLVARKLGFLYIDTGAMYRALTLKALRLKLDLDNKKPLIEMSQKSVIELIQEENGCKIFLDGEDVSKQIRTEQVSANSHFVALIPEIREILWKVQRSYRNSHDIVMEGRDIGTVVFPDAEVKIYLDASPEERAKRRYLQLKAQGIEVDIEKIKGEILLRDERDSKRDIAPLIKHPEAIVVDTTSMTIEQVVAAIVEIYKEKIAEIENR